MIIMVLAPISRGPVVKGTLFWAHNEAMWRRSKTGSNPIRPHLVMNVIDGSAWCCPMSKSSDAWNAEVSPHMIPSVVNEEFMRGGNALYAVDAWLRDGITKIDVDWIQAQRRIVVPQGFVQMGNDLYRAFSLDKRLGRLPNVAKSRKKDSRIKESIQRIELTTEEVLKEFVPVWRR
jgi:hypothetical protein